jgi:hypothetical protein
MGNVAGKGRLESAKAWDKEGPRVLATDFRDNKSWFFTTLEFVLYLASFEELVAEKNKMKLHLAPCASLIKVRLICSSPTSRSFLGLERGRRKIELYTITITDCTGIISCHPNAVYHSPRCILTTSQTANVGRICLSTTYDSFTSAGK